MEWNKGTNSSKQQQISRRNICCVIEAESKSSKTFTSVSKYKELTKQQKDTQCGSRMTIWEKRN